MTLVHLIFKTHLDIGFTDYSATIINTYFTRFIPEALALAKRTHDNEARFRWTVGAWLMYHYLEQATPEQRREAEAAIEAGDIQWHALPFTTHTELIDASLFRHGLTYSQRLDKRFGRTTIAAKMTDVPGHTRSVVPLLAEAGIKMLHIGVNEASSVPDVPPVFRWRDAESGTEVLVVYDQTYGGVTVVPGMDDVLALVLTGDNIGQPSDEDIGETYSAIGEQVPGAKVVASSLDEFARALEKVRESLPILTSEIGDTWIHGVGSDPTKVRRYRELSRLRREWLSRSLSKDEQIRIDAFSDRLLLIPEHTWGMDEKTHLADYTHYTMADLVVLRQTERAQHFEASWAEQRAYVDAALTTIEGTTLGGEAEARLTQIEPKRPDASAAANNLPSHPSGLELDFDTKTGAITRLAKRGSSFEWADQTHLLALLHYETFGTDDYEKFWLEYNRNHDNPDVLWWGREDFTKPGLPTKTRREWLPTVQAAYEQSDGVAFELALPDEARQFGAAGRLLLEYSTAGDDPNTINITLSWFDKPACRMPEAFWLSFTPNIQDETGWRFEKMGRLVDPRDVVSRGARTLHAVDQKVVYQDKSALFELTTLDAPLVAPGKRSLVNFHNQVPEMRGGVHVNLFNNVWGTNFPMWFEDDAVFRFKLRVE